MNKIEFIYLLFIAIFLTSCAKSTNKQINPKWILSEIQTKDNDISPIKEIYITFEDTTITGSGGCNHYWADYNIMDGEIQVSDVAATKIYCGKTISEIERLYLNYLHASERIKIAGNLLTLSSKKATLIYRKEE